MSLPLRQFLRLFLCYAGLVSAAVAVEPDHKPVAELSARDAVVLGLVEGITEFLPVSSTGHLIIATRLLGLESETPLTSGTGEALWYKKPSPKTPEGVPLTIKLAADAYVVVIQVGAIAAVLLLYWRQLMSMAVGIVGRSNSGARLLRNVLFATIPVAILGLALNDWITVHLFSVPAVIGAQIVGAFIMLGAEKWRRANSGIGYSRNEPSDLAPQKAVGIGFAQCLALWPGTSRSMVTIVAGYFSGLTPVKAAEFSFLVGLPVLAGAAFLKILKNGAAMVQVFGWTNLVLGGVVATVSATIAVKFLVTLLSRRGLTPFAYYRLVFALVLTVFYLI